MGLEIRQVHPHFVGEVSGMDLSRPLDGTGVQALWEAIDRYAVLVFHDQRVSDEQLRDFAGNFGKLEIGRSAAEGGKRRLALPEIGDISNLDEEGRLRARDDRRRLDSLGNRIWHTDASYILYARTGRARNAARGRRASGQRAGWGRNRVRRYARSL